MVKTSNQAIFILVCFWLGATLHEQETAQSGQFAQTSNGSDFEFAFSPTREKAKWFRLRICFFPNPGKSKMVQTSICFFPGQPKAKGSTSKLLAGKKDSQWLTPEK